MTPYDLAFTTPVVMGADDKWAGGPNSGGHKGPGWTEQYGNDYGCSLGTELVAAFTGKIEGQGWYPNLENSISQDGKHYGMQMIVSSVDESSTANNGRVQAYYTHWKRDDGSKIGPGQTIRRGERIGSIRTRGGPKDHLHVAFRERFGAGLGNSKGLDMPGTLLKWASDRSTHTIRFMGDGSDAIPDPAGTAVTPPPASGGEKSRPAAPPAEAPKDAVAPLTDASAPPAPKDPAPAEDPSKGCSTLGELVDMPGVEDDTDGVSGAPRPVLARTSRRRATALASGTADSKPGAARGRSAIGAAGLLALQHTAGNRAARAAIGASGASGRDRSSYPVPPRIPPRLPIAATSAHGRVLATSDAESQARRAVATP